MTAGQQVTLQPALALVLGEDLHHPPVGRQVVVIGDELGVPGPVGHLEEVLQPVGRRLVWTEDPERVWGWTRGCPAGTRRAPASASAVVEPGDGTVTA